MTLGRCLLSIFCSRGHPSLTLPWTLLKFSSSWVETVEKVRTADLDLHVTASVYLYIYLQVYFTSVFYYIYYYMWYHIYVYNILLHILLCSILYIRIFYWVQVETVEKVRTADLDLHAAKMSLIQVTSPNQPVSVLYIYIYMYIIYICILYIYIYIYIYYSIILYISNVHIMYNTVSGSASAESRVGGYPPKPTGICILSYVLHTV